MVGTPPLSPNGLRERIQRMRDAHIDWESIADEVGIPVPECQAVFRGEAVVSLERGDEKSAEIIVHRNIAYRMGIVVLIDSLGIARTGKTTLAMELGALCAVRGAGVALVDADALGHGLYHATTSVGDLGRGLLEWRQGMKAGVAEQHGGWILPGSRRPRHRPVDVWAMPPGPKRPHDSVWPVEFWRWVRTSYSVVIVDGGEGLAEWALPARAFADQTLVVLPQDPVAVGRLFPDELPRWAPGVGAVVMGYAAGIDQGIEPKSIAEMTGLPLLAAVPHDPRFANWQLVHSVPWFPSQANTNPDLAAEMEKLLPEPFREEARPRAGRGWRRRNT